MAAYFGDVRDTFDELYETAASFVRLPGTVDHTGSHIRFNLDLSSEQAALHFRKLCYAYEDSFDWTALPLIYDTKLPTGVIRWMRGCKIVEELPIEQALPKFYPSCQQFLGCNANQAESGKRE
jgi:hypothetical protein